MGQLKVQDKHMNQVDEVLSQAQSDFETLSEKLIKQDTYPPIAVTYLSDMEYYTFNLHQYRKAARGMESIVDLLVENGAEENEPIVNLLKEVSTDLFWVSQKLSTEETQ
jgi:cob(I)alamin adenosyltransferase